MTPDEKTHLIDKLMVPFNALTKHLRDHAVIEEAKLDERQDSLSDKYEMVEEGHEAIRKVDGKMEEDSASEAITTMGTTTSTTQSTYSDDDEPSALKNVDTYEGFQKFADSLIATD